MRIANSNPALLNTLTSTTRGEARPGTLGTVSSAVTSGPRLAGDAFVKPSMLGGRGGCFPGPQQLPDVSALIAVWGLENTQGPINGDQMAAAIEAGVEDKDGQAASSEFQMFSDWAQRNQGKLSPEAKEVMGIYEKYARSAQARGMSGIPDGEFRQMVQEMRDVKDASATAALAELDQAQGPINGDQMAEAIRKGTEDADGKGATDEFKQFADWAKKNEHRLSPEAKEVMAIYEKHAKAAQAQGQSGIPHGDFREMVKEMDGVQDASATAALAELDKAPGMINGDQMAEAIRKGTEDADGKGATDEFKQFADWAKKNEHRLSPEAKEVMGIYEKHAKAAQAQGQSGIPDSGFRQMVREMRNVKDASASRELARLSMTPGRVGGRQMMDAIRRGVGDFDGKSATDEFKMFADWAKKNSNKLSPAAKRVMDVYEKYAKAAQAQGQSGISLPDYRRMLREMSQAARPPMNLLARAIAI
jgi:hypothetical protein